MRIKNILAAALFISLAFGAGREAKADEGFSIVAKHARYVVLATVMHADAFAKAQPPPGMIIDTIGPTIQASRRFYVKAVIRIEKVYIDGKPSVGPASELVICTGQNLAVGEDYLVYVSGDAGCGPNGFAYHVADDPDDKGRPLIEVTEDLSMYFPRKMSLSESALSIPDVSIDRPICPGNVVFAKTFVLLDDLIRLTKIARAKP